MNFLLGSGFCLIPILIFVFGLAVLQLQFRTWYLDRLFTLDKESAITLEKQKQKMFLIFCGVVIAGMIIGWELHTDSLTKFGILLTGVILYYLISSLLTIEYMCNKSGVLNEWEQIAEQNGLIATPSDFSQTAAIAGDYRGRSLQFGVVKQKAVLRLSLNNQNDLWLVIKVGDILSNLVYQMEERIRTNDEKFDRTCLVNGKPEGKIHIVLSSLELRERLIKLSRKGQVRIIVKGQELVCEHPSHIITDTRYLQSLFDLTSDLASKIEVVYQTPPVMPT